MNRGKNCKVRHKYSFNLVIKVIGIQNASEYLNAKDYKHFFLKNSHLVNNRKKIFSIFKLEINYPYLKKLQNLNRLLVYKRVGKTMIPFV